MSRAVASAATSAGAAAASASTSSSTSSAAKRVLVIGGNGFVGSQILRELVARKRRGTPLTIASLSRQGVAPQRSGGWASEVEWCSGDVLQGDERVQRAMKDSSAVISCVGGFGSVATMEKVNGDANANAMTVAKAANVPRFVYISAHHYALPEFLKPGYFTGKYKAEKALQDTFGMQGVQIRPGFIYGTRQVGNFGLPLWALGWPLQQLTTFSLVRSLTNLPVIGSALALPLTPPVSVNAVARAAVDAALQEGEPSKQVVEVDDLLTYEKK